MSYISDLLFFTVERYVKILELWVVVVAKNGPWRLVVEVPELIDAKGSLVEVPELKGEKEQAVKFPSSSSF